jgi:hypothetical protein
MPISLILIFTGIVVALIINFLPKKKDLSLEEDVIIPEPTPEPETEPTHEPETEPTSTPTPWGEIDLGTPDPPKFETSGETEITPAETGPVNTDTPKMSAKSKKKSQSKNKPATKANA